jgi:Mo-co oxidoreductase dimerisation domain
VPIGGIAHAGARGISRVEVRVDDGEWREAHLRDPLSATAWVVWRLDLALPQGEHVVTVRCYDGAGAPQVAGFHSKRATV